MLHAQAPEVTPARSWACFPNDWYHGILHVHVSYCYCNGK